MNAKKKIRQAKEALDSFKSNQFKSRGGRATIVHGNTDKPRQKFSVFSNGSTVNPDDYIDWV